MRRPDGHPDTCLCATCVFLREKPIPFAVWVEAHRPHGGQFGVGPAPAGCGTDVVMTCVCGATYRTTAREIEEHTSDV